MAKIFKSKEMEKEFKELIYEIIPSLNEFGNCGILKCEHCYKFSVICSSCKKLKCRNCEKYKRSKEILFKNCSNIQLDYVVKFLTDLFKISDYSFDFFIDLKPIKEQIKENSDIFLTAKKHFIKNNNYSNEKVLYIIKNRKYWFCLKQ